MKVEKITETLRKNEERCFIKGMDSNGITKTVINLFDGNCKIKLTAGIA